MMEDVLASMMIVEWYAKDLHYRSSGREFYSLHLLADRITFGSAHDDLIECYYLGSTHSLPPTEKALAERAAGKAMDLSSAKIEEILEALRGALNDLVAYVEDAKRDPIVVAGVHAILDGISQNALTGLALVNCTLSVEGNADGNDGDTIA